MAKLNAVIQEYNLVLSEEELKIIYILLGSIKGNPDSRCRKFTSKLYNDIFDLTKWDSGNYKYNFFKKIDIECSE